MNITSTAPSYSYIMVGFNCLVSVLLTDSYQIDSDYYLPVVMQQYFVQSAVGQGRVKEVLK